MNTSPRDHIAELTALRTPSKPVASPAPDRVREELALRASGLGLWVFDFVTGEFETSPRFRQILGQDPFEEDHPEFWGDIFAHVHADDRCGLREAIEAHVRGLWPLDHELRMRACHPDFRWYRITGCAHFDGDQEPVLIAGALEDVNARRESDIAIRRSEAEMRRLSEVSNESEARLRQLTEHMDDVFWLEDLESSRAIHVTPSLEELLPDRESQFLDAPRACLAALAHVDDVRAGLCPTELPTDGRSDTTFRVPNAEGTVRWLHVRTFPVADENGRPYRVAGIIHDATEAHRSQERLREAQKLESIGQLAAGVAHEINTPVQYVGDNLHFLRESLTGIIEVVRRATSLVAATGPERERAVERLAAALGVADVEFLVDELPLAIGQALEGTGQVARIVRAMKDFSHPGAPDKAILLDVNKTVESATTVCRNEWKYVAELGLDLAGDLPLVPSFPGSLAQVVLNIVVNAAHAIADVSKVSGTLGRIEVRTRLVDGEVEISIADSGRGIPDSIRHRVFDPFFTTKEVGKGTGQGLALAWSTVVEQHRGRLYFESVPGAGTTFFIRLPTPCGASVEVKAIGA